MSPTDAGNYQIRSLKLATDMPALLQLIEAVNQADNINEQISESSLLAEIEWHGNDPEQDRWVIETPEITNTFLGHAWIFAQTIQRSFIHVAIHPDYRRQGLGSALLKTALERAVLKKVKQVVAVVEVGMAPAEAFLSHHGFVVAGYDRVFTAPGNEFLPAVTWPSGFKVRSLAEFQDVALYVKALNLCYSVLWGHAQNTRPTRVEDFSKAIESYPEYYNPQCMLVVFDEENNVCGVCSGTFQQNPESQSSVKLIDSPAIAPAYWSTKLIKPLVLAIMQRLNTFGEGDFRLETWGDSDTAVSVYEDIGFTLVDGGLEAEYLLEGF